MKGKPDDNMQRRQSSSLNRHGLVFVRDLMIPMYRRSCFFLCQHQQGVQGVQTSRGAKKQALTEAASTRRAASRVASESELRKESIGVHNIYSETTHTRLFLKPPLRECGSAKDFISDRERKAFADRHYRRSDHTSNRLRVVLRRRVAY